MLSRASDTLVSLMSLMGQWIKRIISSFCRWAALLHHLCCGLEKIALLYLNVSINMTPRYIVLESQNRRSEVM